MDSKWIWVGLATVATGLVVWVFVKMLFGDIREHLYGGLNAEAKVQLSHLCDLEKDYYSLHRTYSMSLDSIGFIEDSEDGSKFVYEVGFADSSRFIARAFCKADYDKDRQQLSWEIRESCTPVMISED
ncbi:MAG: hypothetical protein RLZZ165_1304 [Bacteroidota bacterium]|jgi:hypothetical protein